jgi:formamidopyrimidine-DNA glycosylase
LTNEFDRAYFDRLLCQPELKNLSAKAFLATEQRILGLGNGVLQDILWRAKIHPKGKISTLSDERMECLYSSVKSVLTNMAELGGRDTEKDLFGNNGSYKTMMSKNSLGFPCIDCGGYIKKESYMGGSVYYCESCQVL